MSSKRLPPDPKKFPAELAALPEYVDSDPENLTEADNAYAKAAGEIWQIDLSNNILIPQIEFPGYPFQDHMMAVYGKAMLGHPFYIKVARLCHYAQWIINILICEMYLPEELEVIAEDQEKDPNILRERVLARCFAEDLGLEAKHG